MGKLVALAESRGCQLAELKAEDLTDLAPGADPRLLQQLTVAASVAARHALGGTAPDTVREAIDDARKALNYKERLWP